MLRRKLLSVVINQLYEYLKEKIFRSMKVKIAINNKEMNNKLIIINKLKKLLRKFIWKDTIQLKY